MNKLFSLLLILPSAFIFSCSDEKNTVWNNSVLTVEDMFESFSKEYEIEGEVYIHDSINLLKPIDIAVINDLMFINDNYDGKLFSIFDMKENKFIGRFLKQGKGPGEYIGGFSVSIRPFTGDSLMAYYVIDNSLSIFSPDKIRNRSNMADRSIRLLPPQNGDTNENCFVFTANKLMTSGVYKKGRFYIYDLQGNDKGYFGTYPKIEYNGDLSNQHLGDKYGSNMKFTFNYEEKKFACTSPDSFTLFSFDDNEKVKIRTDLDIQWNIPVFANTDYTKSGRARVLTLGTEEDMIGAGYAASSEKYIFFPFSQHARIKAHMEGLEDWFGYIFVMDWNGNPVARLKLDKRIKFMLEIDKEEKYLYSIHTDIDETGMRQIVRYNIEFLNSL